MRRWFTAGLLAILGMVLVACGGGSSSSGIAAVSGTFGPAGGTLTGPDGVQVVVPPGALSQATTIGIARSSAGAPAALDAFAVSGHVYELTPHGLTFSVPVTIRAPLGNSADTQVFMASPGQGWRPMSANLVNGFAEWERSSFSWMYTGFCSVPSSMSSDPYWCASPLTAASLTATPTQGLVQTAFASNPAYGDWGAYRVDQAANLQFKQHVRVPGNCSNVSVKLLRRQYVDIANLYTVTPQTVSTQSPVMVADTHYLTGDAIFAVPFTSADSGGNQFVLVTSFDCPSIIGAAATGYSWDYAHLQHTDMVGDGMLVTGNVSVPAVFHTVAGTISGLTGSGLVLQNNGADNIAVAASGTSFSFATPIVAGSSYNVTVLTQPAGNNCTVGNGSGTANTDISNVTVSCVPVAVTGGLALVANSGVTNGVNGLAVYRADATTGALSFLSNVNAGNTPYALAVTPNGLYAYVSNQQGDSVSEYSVDSASGVVSLLGARVSNNASGIAMDHLGRYIWVANFGWNTVQAFAIGSNGVLAAAGAPISTLQSLPYAIAAHPTMDFVYVAHSSGFAITVHSVNPADGSLTLQQTLSNAISSPTGLVIDPSGRFAYAATQGGGVCAYRINATNGQLTINPGCANISGATFAVAVHPNGQYVYATDGSSSGNVVVFAINQTTGALTQVGSPYSVGNSPRGVAVSPGGNFLYVTNYISNNVSTFSISGGGATLAAIGSAIATGNAPQGIVVAP